MGGMEAGAQGLDVGCPLRLKAVESRPLTDLVFMSFECQCYVG